MSHSNSGGSGSGIVSGNPTGTNAGFLRQFKQIGLNVQQSTVGNLPEAATVLAPLIGS